MNFKNFFLIACTFLGLHLSSQNVQPTITDPAELAAANQRKDEIFEKLFKDPTNLSLLFEYANLSILVGDLEGAIGVFEQMLIYDSELPRIRLELGVLYFRLGAYALATNSLKALRNITHLLKLKLRLRSSLRPLRPLKNLFSGDKI